MPIVLHLDEVMADRHISLNELADKVGIGHLRLRGLFDALRGNLVPVALGTAAIAFVIGLVTFRVLKKGLAELQAAVPGAADAR